MKYALWMVQGVLAIVFVFSGGMKLILIPLALGLLAAFVAYGRSRMVPLPGSSRPAVLEAAS